MYLKNNQTIIHNQSITLFDKSDEKDDISPKKNDINNKASYDDLFR